MVSKQIKTQRMVGSGILKKGIETLSRRSGTFFIRALVRQPFNQAGWDAFLPDFWKNSAISIALTFKPGTLSRFCLTVSY
jgi:hypothetical protein